MAKQLSAAAATLVGSSCNFQRAMWMTLGMRTAGGYYLAMAASKVVAERLTITGSIGVITGKFNLGELYKKIGYSKELISKGR